VYPAQAIGGIRLPHGGRAGGLHPPARSQATGRLHGRETFKQLIGETRQPLPHLPGRVERFDHVYVRNGVANLFLAFEPLAGWRTVAVTDHRRRLEWAQFVKSLVDGRYKDAERVVLVMDQLNTHSAASLYEAFPPDEAKRDWPTNWRSTTPQSTGAG
jgi:hypothetical protein